MTTYRRRTVLAAALGGAVAAGGCTRPSPSPPDPLIHGRHTAEENTVGLTPDQALTKLREGNTRFVDMAEISPNLTTARLMAVSGGQDPFVGVLGCVDSRVPPELVFDRGLGDMFDTRIAGAVADDAAIGSLEFGVGEFGIPLLVVLGHSRCGAVTAAAKAVASGDTREPGKISAVVDPILPAVRAVLARGVVGDAAVDQAAKEVVRAGVAGLTASPILAERFSAGKLRVVGAFYDLSSGEVEFLS